MFEIGSSLREARIRRGLELDAVQRSLRIRRRYLEAIEEDRFELLPGEAYARGFLREYAEFLGLDGSVYVEEYNARFAPREDVAIAPAASVAQPPHTGRNRAIALVVAAIVVATVVAAVLGRGGGEPARQAFTQTSQPPRHTTVRTHAKAATRTAAKPRVAQLRLAAARGDCWLGIRLGSDTGRTLYWQTLPQGSTVSFAVRQPLWVRIGAGANLDATVDGKPLGGLPQLTGTIVVRPRTS